MSIGSFLSKQLISAALLFASFVSTTPVLADPPGDGWKLVFSDEFSEPTLDQSKWSTCYYWRDPNDPTQGCSNSNGEMQWYVPYNVLLEDGNLRLRALNEQLKPNYPYSSGMVSSHDKFTFLYGYAEMRAKMPKGKALWSAFWLSPKYAWPPEIDIVEYLGQRPNEANLVYHYGASYYEHEFDISTYYETIGKDYSEDYHTFAVEWSPDAIVWYVDGVERKRFEQKDQIATIPMYIVVNLAVGGNWPGTPDSTTPFPAYYDVDYVRVWQR
ncbi:glycoside hydrolase family 16 protein [Iningainema tapete]|uniref:Glycoside hydrolase family 16 protein n=1 Tax=Iningainema tapete BLCC-T55 TaxID=2748662 RepID=A0A8J6XKR3_9CYAN|nr:glycoside hydrolase family 16 protein [Iningainema tapete]MBD2772641.1 glycoside hydrolase family 16 protein [Iningainema tapete BLCC-T55]